MITGNKGEWSEVYALFKLLADGKLFSGDSKLNKIEDLFFPIIKIIKNETGNPFEYELKGNLVFISDNKNQFSIPIEDFKSKSILLLKKIKAEKGAFGYPEIEEFMNSFNSKKLKATSTAKTDIKILIHDLKINQVADLGFSIKSELGGDPTLLNAGETTNFIYKIDGYNFSKAEIDEINSINTKSKIKDRITEIKNKGGSFSFHKTNRHVFKNNLVLIDSLLPNILAEIVYLYYTSKFNSIQDLVQIVKNENPLKYDTQSSHSFYEYKIKRFLTDVALGMMPSKVWSGIYDATGGHLIVRENGDVLCYHIYNRNQFEDFLYNTTRLETAGSTKHKYGKLYQDEDDKQFYFKLNLQVRYK
ncbi:MAG: HpaII family restriction endonuclease [Flavobacterium sp.]